MGEKGWDIPLKFHCSMFSDLSLDALFLLVHVAAVRDQVVHEGKLLDDHHVPLGWKLNQPHESTRRDEKSHK